MRRLQMFLLCQALSYWSEWRKSGLTPGHALEKDEADEESEKQLEGLVFAFSNAVFTTG
jgi:hypothetical protein